MVSRWHWEKTDMTKPMADCCIQTWNFLNPKIQRKCRWKESGEHRAKLGKELGKVCMDLVKANLLGLVGFC